MATISHPDVSHAFHVKDDITMSTSTSAAALDVVMTSGCVVVNSSAMLAYDDSKDLVSTQTVQVMNSLKSAVLIPLFFFIGFPTNLLNLLVFFKHGLKQRINLCLFSLSLVDLIYLTFAFLMYADQIYPHDFTAPAKKAGLLVQFIINNHLLGCFGFSWASWFVSTIIALERCFCVLWPLRSATLLKTRTTGVIVLVGVLVIAGARFAVTEKYQLMCFVDVATGRKSLQITATEYYLSNKELVNGLDGVFFGLALPLTMSILVILSTTATAVALKKSLQFRKESSSSSAPLSAQEVVLTKMLIYLSVQFVILQMPGILLRISLLFLPQLNTTGRWAKLYFFMVGLVEVCSAVNSSINFVIYFGFGSKYRQTVHAMLCRHTARAKNRGLNNSIYRAKANQG